MDSSPGSFPLRAIGSGAGLQFNMVGTVKSNRLNPIRPSTDLAGLECSKTEQAEPGGMKLGEQIPDRQMYVGVATLTEEECRRGVLG